VTVLVIVWVALETGSAKKSPIATTAARVIAGAIPMAVAMH
jgi:hypothetical protein